MRSPTRSILPTYCHGFLPLIWIIYVPGTFLLLGYSARAANHRDVLLLAPLIGVSLVSVTASFIVNHLKEMIGSGAATLLPNGRERQVRFAAMLAGLYIASAAVVLVLSAGLNPLTISMFALFVATFAVGAVAAYISPGAQVLFMLPMSVIPFLSQPRRSIDMRLGWLMPSLVIAGSVVLLVALARRLLKFNEEMPEYARRSPTDWRGLDRWYSDAKARQVKLPREWWRSDALPLRHYPNSLWGRARQWQHATIVAPTWAWFATAALSAWMIICTGPMQAKQGAPALQVAAAVWIGILPLANMSHRRAMVSFELLRPISRRDYFLAAGTAMLGLAFRTWLIAVAVAWLFFVLADPRAVSRYWVGGARLTLLTLCVAILLFGVTTWLSRYRFQHWLMFVAMAGTVGPSLGASRPLALWLETLPLATFIAYAMVPVLLGALILRGAYRHWLSADID